MTKIITLNIDKKGTPFKEEILLEKNKAPTTPEKLSPMPLEKIKKTLTLRWRCQDKEGDPLFYDLYLGKNGNLREVFSHSPDTAYELDGLEYNTLYNWQVIAKDGFNQTTSPVWTFRTTKAPTQCTLEIQPGIEEPFEIYLNDQLFNNKTSFKLQEGIYQITVKKIGFEHFKQDEIITWDDLERGIKVLTLHMKRATVPVRIEASQNRSNVLLNGVYQDKTPCTIDLDWGKKYQLTVVKEGFYEVEKNIQFNPEDAGNTQKIDFSLDKISTVLKITASEPDAKITINGNHVGNTPHEGEILWGESYKIIAEKDGFKTINDTVLLDQYTGEFEKHFKFNKKPVLFKITTVPDTADIFIDNHKYDQGVTEIPVEWGNTFEIKAVKGGYKDKIETVSIFRNDIEAGKHLNLILEKKPVILSIDANITGAEVLIDSIHLGYTPLTLEYAWGTLHDLEIKELGYKSYFGKIDLESYIPLKKVKAQLQKMKIETLIETEPEGASVYIDNVQVGTTPLECDIPWGKYLIRFELFGYSDFEKDLELSVEDIGWKKTVTHTLEKKKASVKMLSTPSEAEVYIDDVQVGTTPYEGHFYPGKYRLLIQKDKYKTISEELKIGLNDVYRENEKIFHLEKQEIQVALETVPEMAEVYINDTFKGTTPLNLSLYWGEHNISFKKAGFFDLNNLYTLEKSGILTENLKKMLITLTFISQPTDATVFVDNESVGKTPMKMDLYSGVHTFSIKKEGFESVSKEISLSDSEGGTFKEISVTMTENSAFITLNVNIPDASVKMNNTDVGKYTFEIDSGTYWLEVGKNGYSKYGRKLELQPGAVVNETIVLEELDTTIEFKNPLGADIFLDGRQMGWAPKTVNVEPGEHQITLRKTGMKIVDQKVKIEKGDRIIISFDGVERSKSTVLNTGTLVVNGSPIGSQVYLNGELTGIFPMKAEIEIGKYLLTLKKEGYLSPDSQYIYVEKGQTTLIENQLIKDPEFVANYNSGSEEKFSIIGDLAEADIKRGTLRFTQPKSMSIYIDGVFKGWIPMDIKLIPGEYKVSIEDSNNKYCASRITVKADEILDII
jgi:hypothetical protein